MDSRIGWVTEERAARLAEENAGRPVHISDPVGGLVLVTIEGEK